MVQLDNADFLAADLRAGRTYYVIVTPRWGYRTVYFSLAPVTRYRRTQFHIGMGFIRHAIDRDPILEYTSEGLEYMNNRSRRAKKLYQVYLHKWNRKNQRRKLRATLLPEDGR